MKVPQKLLDRRAELEMIVSRTKARLDELSDMMEAILAEPEPDVVPLIGQSGNGIAVATRRQRRDIRKLVAEVSLHPPQPNMSPAGIAKWLGCRVSQVEAALRHINSSSREQTRAAGDEESL